jgi:energy-coupling factor transport system ATP-binding protein
MADLHAEADGTDALVVLDGVTYRYPKGKQHTLQAVNLKVQPGRYVLISGASGSGKSTLVRTFNGLIPHFYGGHLQGKISIGGRSIHNGTVADCFHQIAMVAQNPQAQLFNRTVTRELAFGLESLGSPRQHMDARIAAVAEAMGIHELLDRNPRTLSGGEQQLVAIAAVLVARPNVMVLDEPLANLDPAHVSRLRQILARLLNEGMGVVVCEHRMGATLPDADEVVVLEDGRIVIQGPTNKTLRLPEWEAGSVDLPLAVRIGMELQLDPIPKCIGDVPGEAASTWMRDHSNELPQSSHYGLSAVLQAEKITWTCEGRDILRGVDLDLYSGQCAALVGANGAGKTSLLRVLNGLTRPISGRIWIEGRETTAQPAWQVGRHVGTAFQNPDSQFFKLTVGQEVAVGPKAQGC